MGDYSDEPVLRDLIGRLTVHGPDLIYRGDRSKGTPTLSAVYACTVAHRENPVGWIIFQAKYLETPAHREQLLRYVVEDLPRIAHRVQLANLVCQAFYRGQDLSRRQLRRELDIDRVLSGQYFENTRKTLYWLRTAERDFARRVRAAL